MSDFSPYFLCLKFFVFLLASFLVFINIRIEMVYGSYSRILATPEVLVTGRSSVLSSQLAFIFIFLFHQQPYVDIFRAQVTDLGVLTCQPWLLDICILQDVTILLSGIETVRKMLSYKFYIYVAFNSFFSFKNQVLRLF